MKVIPIVSIMMQNLGLPVIATKREPAHRIARQCGRDFAVKSMSLPKRSILSTDRVLEAKHIS
jgi:hypothetical protein